MSQPENRCCRHSRWGPGGVAHVNGLREVWVSQKDYDKPGYMAVTGPCYLLVTTGAAHLQRRGDVTGEAPRMPPAFCIGPNRSTPVDERQETSEETPDVEILWVRS